MQNQLDLVAVPALSDIHELSDCGVRKVLQQLFARLAEDGDAQAETALTIQEDVLIFAHVPHGCDLVRNVSNGRQRPAGLTHSIGIVLEGADDQGNAPKDDANDLEARHGAGRFDGFR